MSDTGPVNSASPMRVECVIPILNVADLAKSLAFYLDVLGFKIDWKGGVMASVSRDGKPIMLCQGGQGMPGTWVWIGVEDDVAPLYADLRSRGVTIVQEPTNYWWAHEFRIADPDGHVLRFGSEAREDLPKVG
jgi:catechol 2,3-dioxygenase-like lactoylglutathione lyase family enzyme